MGKNEKFSNMKIIITGTRTGIGNALAQHLCKVGHEVWGISRGEQNAFLKECVAVDYQFRFSTCDIGDWGQMAKLSGDVSLEWTHLDALICCAGSQAPIGTAMSVDPLAWSRNIQLNLNGTFYCIRAFYELLRKTSNRAKIVCFSGGGATGARPNFSAYACAKAGVVRLVENLAEEWRDQAIDINAIAPGAINTAMTEEVLALGPGVVGQIEYSQAVKQKETGGASIEKVIGLVDYLLSFQSDGIRGRLISAPWDPWSSFHEHRETLNDSDIYRLRRITPEDRNCHWPMPPS